MDEFEAGEGAECLRNFMQQSFTLDLSGAAEAGGNGIECGMMAISPSIYQKRKRHER